MVVTVALSQYFQKISMTKKNWSKNAYKNKIPKIKQHSIRAAFKSQSINWFGALHFFVISWLRSNRKPHKTAKQKRVSSVRVQVIPVREWNKATQFGLHNFAVRSIHRNHYAWLTFLFRLFGHNVTM